MGRPVSDPERELADARLALARAREQLELLPTLYEAQQDAKRRLDEAERAYDELARAHSDAAHAYADLRRHYDAVRGRHDALVNKRERSWTRRLVRLMRRAAAERADPSEASPPPADAVEPPPPLLAAPEPEPLRARWEHPPAGALVAGYLHISGWAVSDRGIADVTLVCGGVEHPVRHGRPRWDVAALFGDYGQAAGAGLDLTLPAERLAGGRQELELVIRDGDGNEWSERRDVVIDRDAAYAQWRAAVEMPAPDADIALSVCVVGSDGDDRAELAGRLEDPDCEWVILVSAGARLVPDALAHVAAAIEAAPRLDALYADHDVLGPGGERTDPFLKPGWSPELLVSLDYVDPLVAIRREPLARALAAAEAVPTPSALLRALAHDTDLAVERIPRVLATVPRDQEPAPRPSPAPAPPSDPSLVSVLIVSADRRGLLERCVRSIRELSTYRALEVVLVDTSDAGLPQIDGVDRVLRWDGPFNYSAANNLAAEHARGEFLVLLNDDTEVVTPDWIERMLEHALTPGVGVVGTRLVRPDGTLQHGGARLVTRFAAAKNLFEGLPADHPGPRGLLTVARNCSAVTFACAMVERALYERLGGLDPELAVTFNDVDLCLRAARAGRRVVWTPHAELIHHEHASRGTASYPSDTVLFGERWAALLAQADPWYHPELSDIVDYELRLDAERHAHGVTAPRRSAAPAG